MNHREKMMRRIRKEAQSHEQGCDCKTCRAANGDESAKRQLLRELL